MCIATIIIVSYNTRDTTLACLRSVYAETRRHSFEVIVLDNASADGSAEAVASEFPQVKLIASEENLGFALGNNKASAKARGTYILLLNPDTVVLDGALDGLLRFAEDNPQYGVFGGRTVFADGTLNPSSCWRKPTVWNSFCRSIGLSSLFKRSELFSGDTYGGWNRDSVRTVDFVSGCMMLTRRELWEELGGFDPSYFMYGEDWDLCLRAKRLGLESCICPDAEIVHYGGASESVHADKMVRLFSTRVKLYREHYGPVQGRILIAMLYVWALRGLLADGMLGLAGMVGRRRSSATWLEILRRRHEWVRTAGET